CIAVSGHNLRGFSIAQKAAKNAGVELTVIQKMHRIQVPSALDNCSAVVLPTFYSQGMDLGVAEALARYRPVIASATGSYLRESQGEGIYHNGLFTVPVNDVDALSEMMKNPSSLSFWDYKSIDVHQPKVHAQKWLEVMS